MALAEALVHKGIDCNMQDKEGNTAMHYCGKHCYRHVVRMLAMSGGHKSVFIQNKKGQYPADMVDDGPV